MAIQHDNDREVRHGPAWTDVLTASDLCAGVFDVRWDVRPRLRRWLTAHRLPSASSREAHVVAVDAWALLDGGVLCVASVSVPGSEDFAAPAARSPALPAGMRVVGFRAFRLLVAELALAGPSAVLSGETAADPDVLRAEFENRRDDRAAREQAELLATCTDRSSLRWVVTALRTGPPAA